MQQVEMIAVWRLRPAGPDPRAHLWYEHPNGLWARVCDDASWVSDTWHDAPLDVEVTCGRCRDIFVSDSINGRKVFDLRSTRLAKIGTVPIYKGGPCYNGGSHHEGKNMPVITVPMLTFARFCVARTDTSQQSIVDGCFEIQQFPQYLYRRDYYRPLRDEIKRHWRTGDLGVLEDTLPLLPRDPHLADRRENVQKVGRAYCDEWREQGYQYIETIDGVKLPVGPIIVTVNPDLAIRNAVGDEYVVKLWYRTQRVSRNARRTLSFLLEKAQSQAAWPVDHLLAIWDIPGKTLLPAIPSPPEFESTIDRKANQFADLWPQ